MHFVFNIRVASLATLLLCPSHVASGQQAPAAPAAEPAAETELSADDEKQADIGPFHGKARVAYVQKIRALTDEQLLNRLAGIEILRGVHLAEAVRRAAPPLTQHLKQRYETLRDDYALRAQREPDVSFSRNDELLLFSALRKSQGLPDPVPVVIKGPQKRSCMFPKMPTFEVSVVNRHPDKQAVMWSEGGNYRHGRRESFSFHVVREGGKQMPVEVPLFTEGGIISFVELEPGEQWTNWLPLLSYIEVLPPGEYSVQAAYAFGKGIGTIQDKSTVFVVLSAPIHLTVAPREIPISGPESKRIAEHIRALKPESPVRIVEGGYRADTHADFIAPTSPAGQLLQLEWKSVPQLIDALGNDKLEPGKRAWILALLYSITGQNNPQTDVFDLCLENRNVLGDHKIFSLGWSALSRSPDGSVQGGFGPSMRHAGKGKIDVPSQLKLVREWIAWKKNIKVVKSE